MIEFVDTNIVLYSLDADAGHRYEISIALLSRLLADRSGVVSVQVLVEFYQNAIRKFRMTSEEAETILEDFALWRLHCPDYRSVISAVQLQRRYQLAWYDAMILNSAIESGCSVLWTEDFQDGQRFGDLVVRNPYKHLRAV
ncbi:MAG TPA: PIN domain-containing protein [Bryobacteraceae bacterium]|jgi:predicted nucleic acid-binding protein